MALNVVHNYSYTHDVLVELEMHWNHDEDYKNMNLILKLLLKECLGYINNIIKMIE